MRELFLLLLLLLLQRFS